MNLVILIPTYNSVKTLGETLKSVLNQSELNKLSAVYLADDCSKDDSVAVAASVWSSFVKLNILHGAVNRGERGNVNNAMLTIVENADWVLLLHSDDIAKSNWLEMMISRIDKCSDEVGSICSSWDVLLPDGSTKLGEDKIHLPVEVIAGEMGAVKSTIKRGCWWHISGCAIRTKAFKNIGDFRTNMPQLGDWEWLLRCLSKGWSIEYIPRTLILYRQHESSVSHASFKCDKDIIESLEIVRQFVPILSRQELLLFHLRRCWYLVRRFVRTLTELQLKRSLGVLGNMRFILSNMYHCLQVPRVSAPEKSGGRLIS